MYVCNKYLVASNTYIFRLFLNITNIIITVVSRYSTNETLKLLHNTDDMDVGVSYGERL